jgi:hypothetical protein
MNRKTGVVLTLATTLAALAWANGSSADQSIPIFDAHLHYNWEPKPYYSIPEVTALFRKHNVTGVLANSRPNLGTQELFAAKTAGLWVVPFIRPYTVREDKETWFDSEKTVDLINTEFKRGNYQGIGEFHLDGSQANTSVVQRTVDFAISKNLYMHAHSDAAAIEALFAKNARAKVIWAHTGFSLETAVVERLIRRYPALWCELSYRDGLTDFGKLTPEWRRLFETYPDRFLLGSDTWIESRWQGYGEIMADYRGWLKQLPATVAAKIANQNAQRLFKASQR